MKLCTTTRLTGLDGKEHFAVVAVGQPNWPLALCGFTNGNNAQQSEAEANLFADAPSMLDMLEVLVAEFSNVNPSFLLSAGKMVELTNLADRAALMCKKHRTKSSRSH